MKKLACSLLIIIFVASSTLFMGNVHASSAVGGLITSDTTWSAARSPYQLTGPVGVPSGVTLTIEPGATVDFSTYYLQVNGTLNARGTSDNKINLMTTASTVTTSQVQLMPSSTSWSDQTGSGCIIENASLNTASIIVRSCSPKISNNVFNTPFWMAVSATGGGSPSITGNVINNATTEGVSVTGSSIVENNLFNGTSGEYTPTALVAHNNAYVLNNKILNYYNGINVDGEVTVKDNVVTGCSNTGIISVSSKVSIQSNYVANNQIGIGVGMTPNGFIDGGGIIENNAIINNAIGIQILSTLSSVTVTNNNIVGSTKNSVSLNIGSNIDATNNWWGTTDTQAINQTIRDFKNDFNLGVVNFIPVLNQPSSTAPSNADIDLGQLPTAVPTSQSQPTNTPANTIQGTQPTVTSPNSLGAVSGSSSADDPLAHLNVIEVIEIVLIIVGIVWGIGILAYVNRRSQKKTTKRARRRKAARKTIN